jgi:hypothetical protein
MAESRPTTGSAIDQAFAGDRFQPGLRLSAQHFDECGNAWELAYFGFQYWDENASVLGDPTNQSLLVQSPSLRYDDIVGGFDTSVAYSYRARTNNVEINRWVAHGSNECWKVDRMIGFRYFNFEERLAITGIDSTFGTETLDSASYNSMFGLQVGGRIERTWEQLQLFVLGKAGLYANNRSYRLDDIVVPSVGFPPPDINDVNDAVVAAGLFEIQAGFRYQLTQRMALTTGYTVLYVPGAALRPEFDSVGVRTSGGLVLHGASAGIDLCW